MVAHFIKCREPALEMLDRIAADEELAKWIHARLEPGIKQAFAQPAPEESARRRRAGSRMR